MTHAPLSAGKQATRTDLGGMAADVKHQHILKCFEKGNVMALLARIIEAVFGKAQFVDLRLAKQPLPRLRVINKVGHTWRPSIPSEFVCSGPIARGACGCGGACSAGAGTAC